MFGKGAIYETFNYFWLLGGLLPVAFYVAAQATRHMSPTGWVRKTVRTLNAPIMLGAMGWLPPATPLSFSSWAIVGLVFNLGIRKRWPGWWRTYNYLTAAALDAGLILSTIIVFFAITFPEVTIPQWWGNVDVFNTADASYTAILKFVGQNETFGPSSW
ncbi:hypothetical protein VTK73DRAFT_9128 [Phialemonium thermophilum]|uniref:Oligopeptide transporter n=1 Tax=Phialemonium thermophilum TaxID=223376 RepID=A0ABR3W4B6_9PEZI